MPAESNIISRYLSAFRAEKQTFCLSQTKRLAFFKNKVSWQFSSNLILPPRAQPFLACQGVHRYLFLGIIKIILGVPPWEKGWQHGDATSFISFLQPNNQCHPTCHFFSSTEQPYLLWQSWWSARHCIQQTSRIPTSCPSHSKRPPGAATISWNCNMY